MYQVIEIHNRKPTFGKQRWWTVLVAGGNHEPLMSSEVLNSEQAAMDNAMLVAAGRPEIAILYAEALMADPWWVVFIGVLLVLLFFDAAEGALMPEIFGIELDGGHLAEGELVESVVVCTEVIGVDGEKRLGLLNSKPMTAWQMLGILQACVEGTKIDVREAWEDDEVNTAPDEIKWFLFKRRHRALCGGCGHAKWHHLGIREPGCSFGGACPCDRFQGPA